MRAKRRSWSCGTSADSAWKRQPTCCTCRTTPSSATGGSRGCGCCASWKVSEMNDSSARWRRVEELCHAALERDARDRSAFLAAACGGDVELRREVEALLAH